MNAITSLVHLGFAGGNANTVLQNHLHQFDIVNAKTIFIHVAKRMIDDGWGLGRAQKEAASRYAPKSEYRKRKGEEQSDETPGVSFEGAIKKVQRIYDDYDRYKQCIEQYDPFTPEEADVIAQAEKLLSTKKR